MAKQIPAIIDNPYVLGLRTKAPSRLNEPTTLFAKAEEKKQELTRTQREEHQEKLAKIYLARGRNETYGGNYKEALPRYKKVVNLKVSREPELLNDFSPVWLSAGAYEAALPFSAERTDNSRKRFRGRSPDLAMILNHMAACTTGLTLPNTKTVLSSYADLLVRQRNQEEISALISDLQVAFPNLFTDEKEKLMETSP